MKVSVLFLLLFSTLLTAQNGENNSPPQKMVLVPGGNFVMGSEIGDPDEKPRHIEFTEAFFIDIYEVSNAEFAEFDSTFKFPKGLENSPAVVNWFMADAYAKSIGKRLPTEKEWEKAARGTDGRMFPWGNSFDETFVAWDHKDERGSAIAKPQSPYGCYDMSGSVWEWTSDWYKPYSGNIIPMEEYGEKYKVMRGGSNFNNFSFMRTSQRYYLLPDKISKYFVGFRCVKDIK